MIYLDLETYYDRDYSVRRMTTEEYIRDARFEPHGIGVKVDYNPAVWMSPADFRVWSRGVPWNTQEAVAHHAHFDGLALSHHFGIRPGRWRDTLSMARLIHGTAGGLSLEALAVRYGLGEKGSELAASQGKALSMHSPEEWRVLGGYCKKDVELLAALYAKLLPLVPELELELIDLTIKMFTEPRFEVDQGVLQGAVAEEREKKRRALARVAGLPPDSTAESALEAVRETVGSSEKLAGLFRALGVKPPTKRGKAGMIYAFAKTDAGMTALLEHERPEVAALAEARLLVKSTIIETRAERFAGIGRRGAFPVHLLYAGAHTHRWSGAGKQNAQNLNRGGALRKSLRAPAGYVIVVADSSQVEARGTAWLAGETSLLETFRRNDVTGGDFYSDAGSVLLGRRVSKKETPELRQLCKVLILGLGYSLGWPKLAASLLVGFLGADPIRFGEAELREYQIDVEEFLATKHGDRACGEVVDHLARSGARLPREELAVHCAVAWYLVRRYRSTYARISGLWYACNRLLEAMLEDDPRVRFGAFEIRRHAIRKPTGTLLRYPGLAKDESGYHYLGGDSGREWVRVYGGKLTENLVQSLARDIVGEQAVRVRDAGYPVLTLTHDEIVTCVPEEQGQTALEEIIELMRTPPAWCADMPLNASGGVGRSYGEAK